MGPEAEATSVRSRGSENPVLVSDYLAKITWRNLLAKITWPKFWVPASAGTNGRYSLKQTDSNENQRAEIRCGRARDTAPVGDGSDSVFAGAGAAAGSSVAPREAVCTSG
jgi:hypothetical protein